MIITGNDLKTKGTKAIQIGLENALEPELFISVRGKTKYVVFPVEEYDAFRDYQLTKALEEAQNDIKNGNFITDIDEHINALKV